MERRRLGRIALLAIGAGIGSVVSIACSSTDSTESQPTGTPCTSTDATVVDTGTASDTGSGESDSGGDTVTTGAIDKNIQAGTAALIEGQKTFRFDTFGDEAFWGDTLKLHQAIEGSAHGGVGAGVSPKAALAVGLKVDAESLPSDVVAGIKSGAISLDDPATTLAVLKLNAVVGVTGIFKEDGTLKSIGIQCAFCHSTVDDSFSPGIGTRLDGWPNRDLDVGAIVNLSPDLTAVATLLGVDEPTVRTVLKSWGPGKFDAELFLDGKAMRPDGKSAAALIPPAFGLAGVNLHTYSGWGSITYWNAFVANLEMHGQGTFFDPRLGDETKFPVAAKNKLGHKADPVDMISKKLGALQDYQLALAPPRPPEGSFDKAAAERGDELFEGKAKCSGCHVEPTFSEPGWNMHSGAEIGIDDFQAMRSPDGMYRTTPLRGMVARKKGGFYHDGRFPTLMDVVDHYDAHFKLSLMPSEKSDIVEYLKAL